MVGVAEIVIPGDAGTAHTLVLRARKDRVPTLLPPGNPLTVLWMLVVAGYQTEEPAGGEPLSSKAAYDRPGFYPDRLVIGRLRRASARALEQARLGSGGVRLSSGVRAARQRGYGLRCCS